MDSIEAKVLVAILKDVIVCMNLELNMCHGHLALKMTQQLKDEPHTSMAMHSTSDAVRSNKILRDTLDKINK